MFAYVFQLFLVDAEMKINAITPCDKAALEITPARDTCITEISFALYSIAFCVLQSREREKRKKHELR